MGPGGRKAAAARDLDRGRRSDERRHLVCCEVDDAVRIEMVVMGMGHDDGVELDLGRRQRGRDSTADAI